MRSVVVVAVSEGVDLALELIDPTRQVEAGVEFVMQGASGAFDDAVELRPLGRGASPQRVRLLSAQACANSALNSDPPSTPPSRGQALDAGDAERGLGAELVEQGLCRSSGGERGDAPGGPLGDGIVGG